MKKVRLEGINAGERNFGPGCFMLLVNKESLQPFFIKFTLVVLTKIFLYLTLFCRCEAFPCEFKMVPVKKEPRGHTALSRSHNCLWAMA